MSKKRRRGTSIIESEQGILVMVEGTKNKTLVLPGGGVEGRESRFQAAIRELKEELGLTTYLNISLFRMETGYNKHTVCYVKATGDIKPGKGIKYIGLYKDGALTCFNCQKGYEDVGLDNLSAGTKKIIEKYQAYRAKHQELFETLDAYANQTLKIH